MKIRHLAGTLAVLLGTAATSSAAQAAPPPQPPLVVVISVDQFSLDLFDQYRATYTAGLKRLSDGLVFTGYQSHGATETCPGHSTLLTGDHPSRTGIVANNWYDRESGSNVYCVTKLGVADPLAKTSEQLRVDTLGDWLTHARPGSRSFAVSGKDRAAIMMAGHHPTGVFWWDDGIGFNTSEYAGPADAKARAPAEAFDKALLASWRSGPPALWPSAIPERCKALQKPFTIGKVAYSGEIPPALSKDSETGPDWLNTAAFANELRVSPELDTLTLRFAEDLLDTYGLGRGSAPDLLAISLSATDYIGHRYGSGGPEMCVQMATLDQSLGAFFARLDKLGAPYVVLLTADHGGVDIPERLGPPARRIDSVKILGELTAYLRQTQNITYDPFLGDDPRQLILGLAPDDDRRRPEITAAVIDWLRKRPEVAQVFPAAEVAAAVPPKGKPVEQLTLAERLNESYVPARNGDIIVVWAEGSTPYVPRAAGDTAAGHGSPWDYDRRVPILVWWPGVTQTNAPASMETVDIAPTLAPLLGVTAPADLDGRCVEIGQTCRR